LMSEELGWSPERKASEIQDAEKFLKTFTCVQNNA